jgi:hypothetical protein
MHFAIAVRAAATREAAGVTVRTPSEYRAEAEIYVRRAECADTNARGQRYLEMAQACLRLADLAELLESDSHQNNGVSGPHSGNGRSGPPLFTGL